MLRNAWIPDTGTGLGSLWGDSQSVDTHVWGKSGFQEARTPPTGVKVNNSENLSFSKRNQNGNSTSGKAKKNCLPRLQLFLQVAQSSAECLKIV